MSAAHRRNPWFLLASLGRRTEATWGTFLRQQGLTNAEFQALAALVETSPLRQVEVAASMGIDQRNAGAVVGRLRERGWVESAADPRDARARALSLTPAGRAAWDDLQRVLAPARDEFAGVLSAAELAELTRLLATLHDGLDARG